MNRQTIRIVAGANLVAGCLLLQGCGMFGKKSSEQTPATIPEEPVTPVVTQPVEPVPPVPTVETPSVELPEVQSSTPYTIRKGDTISGISYRYGLRWQDVLAVNPGISPKRLRVGQVIQLPGIVDLSTARSVAPAPKRAKRASVPKISAPKTSSSAPTISGPTATYVVKAGDSLSVIAYRHGIKTAALRAANGLKSDKIIVGQKLKVPAGSKRVASKPAPKKTSAKAAKTTAPKETAKPEKKSSATSEATTVTVTPPPAVETPPAVTTEAPAPTPAPAAAAPAADANTQTYTVKEGEDLYAVAIRWGVSPSDLKSLNNLTSTELKAGTVLKIPNAQ